LWFLVSDVAVPDRRLRARTCRRSGRSSPEHDGSLAAVTAFLDRMAHTHLGALGVPHVGVLEVPLDRTAHAAPAPPHPSGPSGSGAAPEAADPPGGALPETIRKLPSPEASGAVRGRAETADPSGARREYRDGHGRVGGVYGGGGDDDDGYAAQAERTKPGMRNGSLRSPSESRGSPGPDVHARTGSGRNTPEHEVGAQAPKIVSVSLAALGGRTPDGLEPAWHTLASLPALGVLPPSPSVALARALASPVSARDAAPASPLLPTRPSASPTQPSGPARPSSPPAAGWTAPPGASSETFAVQRPRPLPAAAPEGVRSLRRYEPSLGGVGGPGVGLDAPSSVASSSSSESIASFGSETDLPLPVCPAPLPSAYSRARVQPSSTDA
jgi:hypothetical protein